MDASISLTSVRSKHICLSLFLLSTFAYLLSSHLVPITDPVESNYGAEAGLLFLLTNKDLCCIPNVSSFQ
jgi:hypothetical protein